MPKDIEKEHKRCLVPVLMVHYTPSNGRMRYGTGYAISVLEVWVGAGGIAILRLSLTSLPILHWPGQQDRSGSWHRETLHAGEQ